MMNFESFLKEIREIEYNYNEYLKLSTSLDLSRKIEILTDIKQTLIYKSKALSDEEETINLIRIKNKKRQIIFKTKSFIKMVFEYACYIFIIVFLFSFIIQKTSKGLERDFPVTSLNTSSVKSYVKSTPPARIEYTKRRGDAGEYYILSYERLENGNIKALTSRIGSGASYTNFTEVEINCDTHKYFELAGSEETGSVYSPTRPLTNWASSSHWTPLVHGSSKSDLVNYLCK